MTTASLSESIRDRYERIPAKWRGPALVGAIVVLYLIALRLPWAGDRLHEKMPPAVVVIGLITGAVTALLAIGLILVYRSNRFINFAYGAMGSLVGVLAIGMHLQHGWPYFLSLPVGVAAGIALGALIELGVIRRFQNSSRLLLTVASIGLAQLLGGLELLGSKAIGFTSLTGGFTPPIDIHFNIGVKVLGADELLIVLIIPFVIAGLAWFLLRTDAGVAVRASAENADRALLLGIPVRRLATIVWMVAGGLAALTYVLKAPFAGVTPGVANGPTVLLPGLAAAVVARRESLPVAFAAGLGLGIVEQTVRWNSSGTPSFVNVAYLVVILAALLLQRGKLSRAKLGDGSTWSSVGIVKPVPTELRHLPEVRWPKIGLVAAVTFLAIWLPSTWTSSQQLLAAFAIVWAIVAVSLVVLTGWGGHISLGQFALVGVGAVVAGNLVSHDTDLFLALVAAGAAGALAALLVGLPALRIRGLFLAVTTLAFAIALDAYFFNPDKFGSLLPTGVDRPMLWERFDLENNYTMYLLCLAFLALSILVAAGVRKARSGRVLIATRDNERAADASAVPTTSVKLSAFVLSGAIAGVGGGLYVLIAHSLAQGSFNAVMSIDVFSTAVIGGLGSVSGAVIGVLLFRWLETITALGDIRLLLTGVGLLVVLYALPGGLGQVLLSIRDRYLRAVAARRRILVPSLVADRRVEEGIATVEVETEHVAAAADSVPALLETRGVDVSYGPVQVLFGVDFRLTDGEIVALLGTNGAGKSTLLRAICGLTKPGRGVVQYDGDDITSVSADATTRRGVSLMPGGKGVFPTLTVDENLRLASWLIRHDKAAIAASREEVLSLFPILRQRHDQMAGDLSGGEQQMLALAGALMTRPRVLMIDELSLGLAPTIVAQLLDVVREIHRRGTTIVLVEQSVNVALELAERAVFMEKGEVRFEGPTMALLDRPDILRSVFIAGASSATGDGAGADGKSAVPAKPKRRTPARPKIAADAPVVLQCFGVTKRFGGITAVDNVDLSLRDGEIVGLIGHNGAGKTTLMDCLSGFLPLDGGRIALRGVEITDWLPHERARGGLGRSFQDALLYPTLTVAETIAVARERHLASRAMLAAALQLPASFESELETFARVEELVELMGLGAFRDKLTGALSTGSRRIVDLACILAQDPKVLLLDEPSGGVAQRETEALGPMLHQVREHTGCSMIVIEHDMPLLRAVCDRMVALELGGVIAEGTPDEVLNHPRVIESYLGTDESTINRSGVRGGGDSAVSSAGLKVDA